MIFLQNICIIQKIVVPLHRFFEKGAIFIHRGVEQLVARQAHNLEVACSSPASATKEETRDFLGFLCFFVKSLVNP